MIGDIEVLVSRKEGVAKRGRICISVNASWNIVTFRVGLVRRLIANGFDVLIASPDDGWAERLRDLGCRYMPLGIDSRSASLWKDSALFFRYIRLMRGERQVIYLGYTIKPNIYGTLAARLCGVPAVNNVSGLGTAFIHETWLTRLVMALYRLAFAGSHTVFFQNEDDRALFVERRIVDRTRTRLLPGSGIDLTRYQPVPLPSVGHDLIQFEGETERRALPTALQLHAAFGDDGAPLACSQDDRRRGSARGLARSGLTSVSTNPSQPDEVSGHPPGTLVFLLVARLLWDKGVGEFVEAARIVRRHRPEARFQLLGFLDVENRTAVDRASVERWVAEGVVDYLGATDDVRPFIAAADCVVLPSYREGTPRTLLEGAAMGRPLIATDVPGCREVVEDGRNGLLCNVRDAADLAEKMLGLVDMSPAERARMGRAGREKVEREFDEKIVIDSYLEVIDQILAERAAAVPWHRRLRSRLPFANKIWPNRSAAPSGQASSAANARAGAKIPTTSD